MNRCCKWNHVQYVLCLTLAGAMTAVFVSCAGAPTPTPVVGPGLSGNDPPTLQITEPTADVTADQGANFLIQWVDSDPDNNALISFSMVNTETNQAIVLVQGVSENDSIGPDTFTVSTSLIPVGTYNLRGTIDDGVNTVVTIFSETTSANITQRTVIRIVEPGRGQQTIPPVVTVTEPAFNQSVAQDDVLRVSVQPSEFIPLAALPFDPDSAITLFVLLDLDLDPDNDDPSNPDPNRIIVLTTRTVEAGSFEAINFDIPIDLTLIPPRTDGEPYFIRVTADDLTNPRVHQYAVGTISVAQLAAGVVDLFDVGRAISGVRFFGFNPGAQLGSSMSTLTDFDADGVDDFILTAQFGNPRNFGQIGEAYTVYGQDRIRFGGAISVNTISVSVSGVIFTAPPVRTILFTPLDDRDARTDGINDVSFMSDLSGDGRPEILFGLQHVHGVIDAMDYDPGDEDPADFNPLGCYPDSIVNNLTTSGGGPEDDTYFYAGGMALILNSQNRDDSGLLNSNRLETTVVDLELIGARILQPLDATGFDVGGPILTRADNSTAANIGNETSQEGRISGARLFPGGFDFIDAFGLDQGTREGLFGQKVSRLGDLNADGLDEIMVSAPTNEAYVDSLLARFGFFSTQWQSTLFRASILVFPGTNYNLNIWRDKSDDLAGTANTPQLDQSKLPPFGKCSLTDPVRRRYFIPAETFGIFAEDTSDFLGGAVSAGDFNKDGIDDILCGAPLNDRTTGIVDSGAAYVIFGRNVPGDVRLRNANDPDSIRPAMLRIRGVKNGDQIGFTQAAGLDVNGDSINDIFIASPSTDFGAIRRTSCAGDFNGDGLITQDDLNQLSFEFCQDNDGGRVFSDESCKAFDYDNNGVVDSADADVFGCLLAGGADCCDTLVDNGFVAVIFGNETLTGDRTINDIAKPELPGAVFFGSGVGHRAGTSVASAGDFNQDGSGDLLIAVPGEVRIDSTGRQRLGVVYLIFGGSHLGGIEWNLNQVASDDLPGIVFLSPYAKGRPNEAAPMSVAGLGDINNDGFDDIAIGNPMADFIDLSFPQGPDATDAELGRRRDAGDVYIIYGNNFGRNRL